MNASAHCPVFLPLKTRPQGSPKDRKQRPAGERKSYSVLNEVLEKGRHSPFITVRQLGPDGIAAATSWIADDLPCVEGSTKRWYKPLLPTQSTVTFSTSSPL